MVVDNLNLLMDVEYCCSRIVMCVSIDKQALDRLIILNLVKCDMLVSIMIHPQLLGPHMFSKIISPIGGTHTRDCDEMVAWLVGVDTHPFQNANSKRVGVQFFLCVFCIFFCCFGY
jgi:hypothetical protein